MKNLLALIRRLLTLESLAQMASGCLVYYSSVALEDYYSRWQFNALSVLLLIMFVPLAFALLTFTWYRLQPNSGYIPPSPELNLLLGPVIFLPVYFAFLPPFIPQAEGIPFLTILIGGYMNLPFLLIPIQLTPMGWALDLAFVSTLATGHLIRKLHQQPANPERSK